MAAKDSCGAWCVTAQLEDGTYIAVPLSCHSWQCTSCARTMKRRLLRRLRYARPNLFITLTTSARTAPTPDAAFEVANQAIAKLVKRWKRRRPGEPFEYFLVWETTAAGWFHAHLLLKASRVSKHWLSHTWNELTRSYIIDMQPVSSASHAATYLTKYLAKDMQAPNGRRRWRRSAGFFNAAEEPPTQKLPLLSAWKLQPRPATVQAYLWLLEGKAIDSPLAGIIRARDDPTLHLEQMGTMLPYQLREQARLLAPYLA